MQYHFYRIMSHYIILYHIIFVVLYYSMSHTFISCHLVVRHAALYYLGLSCFAAVCITLTYIHTYIYKELCMRLNYGILHFAVLCCMALCYILSHYSISYCGTVFYSVFCHSLSYSIGVIPDHIVLHYIMVSDLTSHYIISWS